MCEYKIPFGIFSDHWLPKSFQVNKSGQDVPEELIRNILKYVKEHGEYDRREREDTLRINDMFVQVTYRQIPFARTLNLYRSVIVEILPPRRPVWQYEDVLVKYNDFTRLYVPGSWQKLFERERTNVY